MSLVQPQIKGSIRKELDIRNEYPIILNVGRLMRQKAQCDIISAASILKEKGMPVNIIIAGEGVSVDVSMNRYKISSWGKPWSLVGFRDDIARLLEVADIFLLPSLEEGLPIALLEAMSARVPIIATPVGEMPNIIQHSVNGLLVPVNDAVAIARAIDWCLRNTSEAQRMTVNAFKELRKSFQV